MIVINKKLAKMAMANAVRSGRVTENSNAHSFLLQSLIALNFIFDVKRDRMLWLPRDTSLDEWSAVEVAAAEAVHWLLAFLEKLRCHDIERLLTDVADYRRRHPDYPKGAWPHHKGPR